MKPQRHTPARPQPDFRPPETWRWVSGFGSGVPRIRHAGHQDWMRSHTERHEFRELMLVLEGGGCYGLNGHPYRLEPGVVMLFDRGEPHDRFYSPFQPACRHLWLRLIAPRKLIGSEVRYKPRRSPAASAPAATGTTSRRHVMIQGPFLDCLVESWDACSAGDTGPLALARLRSAASALILEALARGEGGESDPDRPDHGRAVVDELCAYIAANLSADLSLDTLARLSGYEPHYLERLLRRHAGEPLRRFVNRLRLAKAMDLLAGGMAVSAAGEALGFGSDSYFSRFFTKAAGVSPARWQARRLASRKR